MTGASEITISTEDGQTPGTRKVFVYYNHSLIAEQSLFWIDNGEIVSGEVASVFENKEMYG